MGALDDAMGDVRRERAEETARGAARQAEANASTPFSAEFKTAVREFLERVPGGVTQRVSWRKTEMRQWTLLTDDDGESMSPQAVIVGIGGSGGVWGAAVAGGQRWLTNCRAYHPRMVTGPGIFTATTPEAIEAAAIKAMAHLLVGGRK